MTINDSIVAEVGCGTFSILARRAVAVFILAWAPAGPAEAQPGWLDPVNICNSGDTELAFATVYNVGFVWGSRYALRGWWNIQPGDCLDLNETLSVSRGWFTTGDKLWVGFANFDNSDNLMWHPQAGYSELPSGRGGRLERTSRQFCVRSDAFRREGTLTALADCRADETLVQFHLRYLGDGSRRNGRVRFGALTYSTGTPLWARGGGPVNRPSAGAPEGRSAPNAILSRTLLDGVDVYRWPDGGGWRYSDMDRVAAVLGLTGPQHPLLRSAELAWDYAAVQELLSQINAAYGSGFDVTRQLNGENYAVRVPPEPISVDVHGVLEFRFTLIRGGSEVSQERYANLLAIEADEPLWYGTDSHPRLVFDSTGPEPAVIEHWHEDDETRIAVRREFQIPVPSLAAGETIGESLEEILRRAGGQR